MADQQLAEPLSMALRDWASHSLPLLSLVFQWALEGQITQWWWLTVRADHRTERSAVFDYSALGLRGIGATAAATDQCCIYIGKYEGLFCLILHFSDALLFIWINYLLGYEVFIILHISFWVALYVAYNIKVRFLFFQKTAFLKYEAVTYCTGPDCRLRNALFVTIAHMDL